jgi:uncharacterized repeat protein (TIGR03803 family)
MFIRTCIRPIVAALALAGFGVCGAQARTPNDIKILASICEKNPCGLDAPGRMTPDASGNFFGFTEEGGLYGEGTAFKLYREPGKTKWKFQTIYNFCSFANCQDGDIPESETPVIDAAGNMYGTTAVGGTHGKGIFFKLTPNWNGRQWKLTVLYNFCSKDNDCHDGGEPFGTLTYQGASSGALYDGVSPLYGTNEFAGPHGSGGAFSLTPRFGRWHEQVIYPFCFGNDCTDRVGFDLSVDNSGDLLGVRGGDFGSVFRLTPNPGSRFWTQTILYNFCQLSGCADGADPAGSVVQDASGNLYGIASEGGNTNCGAQAGCGVVYKIAPDNTETVLHAFCSRTKCRDGAFPIGSLTLDPSGALYGVAQGGGDDSGSSFGSGTVFKLTGTALRTLWTFCRTSGCPDGQFPSGGVATDASGDLFGITQAGGAEHDGTVYKLNQ